MSTATAAEEAAARNRRGSYRINDRIALAVRPLSEREYRDARARARSELDRRRTLNSIIAAGESQRGALRNITDADPAIGAYIQGLEDRLERLVRLLNHEQQLAPDRPTHDVNISGNGMRFTHGETLARGSHVELNLQLFPSRNCLTLIAKVVWVRELARPNRAGGRFVVAVDYSDVHEDDRELIIRHVHALQLEHARRGLLRS